MEDKDARIRKLMTKRSDKGELACAVAFAAAEELGINRSTIGEYADEMGLKLIKCQLGLFGYQPEKKIVKPRDPVSAELAAAIRENLENGKLACRKAFAIADELGIKKMDVSGACETLKIKISPCQLGAF